jgi:hypothetical protein
MCCLKNTWQIPIVASGGTTAMVSRAIAVCRYYDALSNAAAMTHCGHYPFVSIIIMQDAIVI